MLINDLIERLYELKREYGSQEVTLYTQRDAWSWEEYDIDEVCHDDGDNLIVIQGKRKTEKVSESTMDFIKALME